MEERLKQRLVGAAVLVSCGVMLAPMVLDRPDEPERLIRASNIPPKPENVFRTRIAPVSEAEILGSKPKADVSAGGTGRGLGEEEEAATADSVARTSAAGDVADATEAVARPGLSAWVVQLGSFVDAANALALRDRLRTQGYPAFVESVRVGDRKIMRVYVGPQLLRAKAAESQKRLEKEVDLRGLIVRYPTS